MTIDKKEFEKKFRALIKPDTSNWKQRLAADRDARDEFRRSQRVASRILEFLDGHPDWSRQRLADDLGVSLQRISIILKGKANFTLKSIETMERVLDLNLLDEPQKAGSMSSLIGVEMEGFALPNYGHINEPSHAFHVSFDPIDPARFAFDGSHWFYTGDINFEDLLGDAVVGESNIALAA